MLADGVERLATEKTRGCSTFTGLRTRTTFQEGCRQAGAPDSLGPVHVPLCAQPRFLPGLERLPHLLIIDVVLIIPVQCWHGAVIAAESRTFIVQHILTASEGSILLCRSLKIMRMPF